MQDDATPAPNGPRPCYWIENDPTMCPAPDTGYKINVERAEEPATGTVVDVECAVAIQ
jgi:hypothetical protein